MRCDYERVDTIPVSVATTRARQHGKRASLSGIATATLLLGHWKIGVGLLIVLATMVCVQKKRQAWRIIK